MSGLNPPVSLEHPENKAKVDYIQDQAASPDFDYPAVSTFNFILTLRLASIFKKSSDVKYKYKLFLQK